MRTDREKRIDLEIGRRLLVLRRMRELSQEDLAAHIGISFQQVQKYEKGINRIATSRLITFSRILDIPLYYFFDGLCECKESSSQNWGIVEEFWR